MKPIGFLIVVALSMMGCANEPRGVTVVAGRALLGSAPAGRVHLDFWPKDDLLLGTIGGTTEEDGNFSFAVSDQRPVQPGTFVARVRTMPAKAVVEPGKPLPRSSTSATSSERKDQAVVELRPGLNDLEALILK